MVMLKARIVMIKSYLNNLHPMTIVRYASYDYQMYIQGIDIVPVVEKFYVVDVFMHLSMIAKVTRLIIKFVHFVELQHQIQKRNQ